MVLEAVAPLGEAYGAEVRRGFAERWIDVYPNKGKSGGAYSTGTYDSEPYILTNFTGTLGQRFRPSRMKWATACTVCWPTVPSRRSTPATRCLWRTVASTVNENLMIEQLLKKEQEPRGPARAAQPVS